MKQNITLINQSTNQLADVGLIPVLPCVSYIELMPALKAIPW